jgi:hypothetical protein
VIRLVAEALARELPSFACIRVWKTTPRPHVFCLLHTLSRLSSTASPACRLLPCNLSTYLDISALDLSPALPTPSNPSNRIAVSHHTPPFSNGTSASKDCLDHEPFRKVKIRLPSCDPGRLLWSLDTLSPCRPSRPVVFFPQSRSTHNIPAAQTAVQPYISLA